MKRQKIRDTVSYKHYVRTKVKIKGLEKLKHSKSNATLRKFIKLEHDVGETVDSALYTVYKQTVLWTLFTSRNKLFLPFF